MIFFIICFVFPILIHHQLEIYTSYCFLVFLIYIFIFHYCLKYQKQVFSLKCLVLSLVTIFLVGSHYFLEPNPIFKQGTSTVLTNITNWFDHPYLDDVFGNHNITGMSSSISGSLPNNDITLDKSIALTVESKASFTGYLRGYSLAHYQNNKWHAVNENYDDFDSGSLVAVSYTHLDVYKRQRLQIAPTSKLKASLTGDLAAFICQYIAIVILLLYLYFGLGIGFGKQIGYILLMSAIGSYVGIVIGHLIGRLFHCQENTKTTILSSFSLFCSFLSGMMVVDLKYLIQEYVPILAYINPVNLITDGLYALYYYPTYERFFLNLTILCFIGFILTVFNILIARRKVYDLSLIHILNEDQIREISKVYEYQVNLQQRKEDVIRLIDEKRCV